MKTLRSKITLKCAALLILGLGTIIGVGVEPEEKEAPLNPFFSNYQKFSNEGILERFLTPHDIYHFGEVPSPVDRSHVKNVVNPFTRDWYPTSYDLRTMNKLTPIRNQGACGSCWTFATMASLESFGKPAYDWNFSEQDLNVSNGFDFGECNGGNHDMATACLARWSGPLS
ncbi:C1 family peptidase, partial [Acidobacteriota bacterium]